MFLSALERENPSLIKEAIRLHKKGLIQPDTYLLDLDQIRLNARKLLEKANKNSITLFFMLKQIGRNPLVAKELMKIGFTGAVVVDFREALLMMENDIPLGNVGHLVQIPQSLLREIMIYGVQYITVYSIEKVELINEIAGELGIKQNILVKVLESDDTIYDGQTSGFSLSELPNFIKKVNRLDNVNIAGITTFPCFLLAQDQLLPTKNLKTVIKAKNIFEDHELPIKELNMPSATCMATIEQINDYGGTQGEPGHALTGTTPLHAVRSQPEKPAILYVSEISHQYNRHSYFYGGGFYPRGHWENVIVVKEHRKNYDKVLPFSSDNIDYYIGTKTCHEIGATVIASFRTQMFVTRSEIAVIDGIHSNKPECLNIFDSQGRFLRKEAIDNK